MSYPNDPFYLFGRNGSRDNPYKNYIEPLSIFAGKVILTEIPYKRNKVVVKDGSTLYGEVYDQGALTTDNVFFVDYDSGIVYFDLSHSGKQLTFTYTGEGYFAIPTTRIYSQSGNAVPTQNIQDMIDNYNQLNGTDLYRLFDPQTGHKHSGAAGDAPPIDSIYVNYNNGSGNIINVQDALDSHNKRFIDIGVNLIDMGAVGDGTTDCTNIFSTSHQSAITNETLLFIPEGTFVIDASVLNNINIASMVGKGIGKTTLIVKGNLNLNIIQNYFTLQGMTIKTDYVSPSNIVTVSNLFSATQPLLGVSIKDVEYLNTSATQDGTSRTNTLFRAHVSNGDFKNIRIDGSRMGIVVQKQTGIDSKNITFKNITFTNTQTGIYATGGNPNITSTDYINNLTFEDISLVNTSAQATQYSAINGSDVIMCERVQHLTIKDLYGEYVCERLAYLNVCQDVKVSRPIAVYSEGIKFCGYVSNSANVYNYAIGFTADDVTLHNGASRQVRALTLYDCKNVFVNTINAYDENSPSGIDAVVQIEQYAENINLNKIVANNVLRGVVCLNMVYSTDFTAYVKGLKIHGIDALNPVTVSGYPAVRTIIDSNFTSGYLFEDILIEGCTIRQTISASGTVDAVSYVSDSYLRGLISIDRVNKLRTRNNYVEGFSNAEGWVIVGADCYDVIVNERVWSLSNASHGNYFSQGSTLEFVQVSDSSKAASTRNFVTIISSSTDSLAVNLSDNSQEGEYEWSGLLTNGNDNLVSPWTSASKIGQGMIVADTGDYMNFIVTSSAVTIVNGTNLTSNANTDTKLCVYLSSGALYFRNRLGADHKVKFSLKYLNQT